MRTKYNHLGERESKPHPAPTPIANATITLAIDGQPLRTLYGPGWVRWFEESFQTDRGLRLLRRSLRTARRGLACLFSIRRPWRFA